MTAIPDFEAVYTDGLMVAHVYIRNLKTSTEGTSATAELIRYIGPPLQLTTKKVEWTISTNKEFNWDNPLKYLHATYGGWTIYYHDNLAAQVLEQTSKLDSNLSFEENLREVKKIIWDCHRGISRSLEQEISNSPPKE